MWIEGLVAFGDIAFLDFVIGRSTNAQLIAKLRDTERVWQARVELNDLTAYRSR